MANEESNARWLQIAALRDELDDQVIALPKLRSRVDGTPREPSPRALRLAQALSVSTSWSRISAARERRLAA